MPRRSPRSRSNTNTDTETTTATATTITSFDNTALRKEAGQWLTDMRTDIHPNTGYIVPDPKGLYGKQIKELTQYICSRSPELNAIKQSRRLKSSTYCLYLFEVFKFLSNYVLPLASALYIAYMYYVTDFTASLTQTIPESVDPIIDFTNTTPIPPDSTTTTTTTTTTIGDWITDSIQTIPSPSDAGIWLGSTLQWIVSGPVQFVGNTLDSALNLSYFAGKAEKLFYTPFVAVAVYFATLFVLRFIINLQILYSAQIRLWNYQDLILQETSQVIERAITQIAQPHLLNQYDAILKGQMDTSLQLYNDNYSLAQLTMIERLSIRIKTIPFHELLKQGGISPQYMTGIFMLIKHADEELGQIMFRMSQELNQLPHQTYSYASRAARTASFLLL